MHLKTIGGRMIIGAMTATLIIDFIIALGTLVIALVVARKEDFSKALQYFTVQSNLFCAAVSLLAAVWALFTAEPGWLLIVKYSATCAVTVTFLTVFLYLGPRYKNWSFLLGSYNFWLHVFCPLLAIASLLLRGPVKLSFPVVFAGLAPVVVYGMLYLWKVILSPPEKQWDDLYGFKTNVKWALSMSAMFTFSFLVSLGLWALLRVA